MKKEEIRMIVVLILISILIIGILVIGHKNAIKNEIAENAHLQKGNGADKEYVQELEDGSKVNVSDKLLQTKRLGSLVITDIQLKEKEGITTLLANVENESNKTSESKIVQVDILDKKGKVITQLKGVVDEIPAGGKTQLNIAVTTDVSNAYDFMITEN